ncbi:S9 family peptidase [Alteribacillus sp. YIM 98480]|uniref:alpha/beta hydrolase family protein n=1 Tax=Alteribacillus sp. YIM 98480 TaxID=2606599 RepID=UPI00131C5EA9|nr:alpha/beta hydrolase [Alteribacillus sp. YIM 98480]
MSSDTIENQSFTISMENDLYIRGNVHAPMERTKKPVVIICHGFKGFKDWNFFPYLGDELANAGFYAIRFNFSHNGVNEKDFDELEKFAVNTYSREQADLAVLFEHMKEEKLPFSKQFDLNQIGVLGHSRGGANALLFAAEHPEEVKAVVTWNGVWDVDFFGDDLKKDMRESGVGYIANKRTNQNMPLKADVLDDMETNKERFHLLTHLEALKAPVRIIQGDADGEWLVKGADKMEKTSSRHSLALIQGANHTFNAGHPLTETTSQLDEAMKETISHFQNLL